MKEIFVDEISSDLINKEYVASFYNDDNFEISFLFKSDFNNAKYLRDYLLVILDVIGINEIWKNRFVLIVDELNNNAIEYGTKLGNINIMRFKSSKKDEDVSINIEVEDCGDGEKAKKAGEMEELRKQRIEKGFTDHKSIRGRGLFMIITKLVDELYFSDSEKGGLIVGVNKKLKI